MICIQSSVSPARNLGIWPYTLKPQTISPRAGLDGVVESLLFAQHAIEMFRRALPEGPSRSCLDRLSNRLTKVLSEARKLSPPE